MSKDNKSKKGNKKVKNGAVKEFPVEKKKKKSKEEPVALDIQKKELSKKRGKYVALTAILFILVLGIAGVVGYYLAGGVTALSQRLYIEKGGTLTNNALSASPMYAEWWYMIALYFGSVALVLLIGGRDRIYHLVGFGIGSAGAMFITYFLTIRGISGLASYYDIFRILFYSIGVSILCFPMAVGIVILVTKILRYNYLVKKGKIIEEPEYMPYEPISDNK